MHPLAPTRRHFLRSGAAALTCGTLALRAPGALASPLGLPLGLQLYAVRDLLAKDYAGTLRQIAALGYQEVEAAGFFGHPAAEVKAAMQSAGLNLVSAHYSAEGLTTSLDESLAFAQALGLRYIVCSFPAFKDRARAAGLSYHAQMQALTLDDFRWTADRLNLWGQKAKAAGLQLAYHNATMEFPPQQGVVPFDELLRLTDPSLVTFELDCGWVTIGGADPVAYLHRYPTRISLLHIKDFKPPTQPITIIDPPPPAELGRGTVDFKPIFEAAKGTAVRHYFVEQEGFDMPPLESLKIDADYMKRLTI